MLDAKTERFLCRVNDRLRAGRIGLTIEVRGTKTPKLYLRGTLPPKPYSKKRKPYQQRICLNMKATAEAIRQAERLARDWGTKANLGTFDWADVIDPDKLTDLSGESVGDWVERWADDYWETHARTGKSTTTFRCYMELFNRLPPNKRLTTELLIDCLKELWPPNTAARLKGAITFGVLAKFAGLDAKPITRLRGEYSPTKVNERILPSDEEIEDWFYWMRQYHPKWAWIYGAIACWGLRTHEAFNVVSMQDFPVIEIGTDTKTGRRLVGALPERWAHDWGLADMNIPDTLDLSRQYTNKQLGNKITARFRRTSIPFRPYDLRHCYARRCVELTLPDNVAARMMGHSLERHIETYRAWIGDEPYIKAYRTTLDRLS